MHRHTLFVPNYPNICMCGRVANIINCANFFFKIRSSIPELEDLEKWHFPLSSFFALTTVLHCDYVYIYCVVIAA